MLRPDREAKKAFDNTYTSSPNDTVHESEKKWIPILFIKFNLLNTKFMIHLGHGMLPRRRPSLCTRTNFDSVISFVFIALNPSHCFIRSRTHPNARASLVATAFMQKTYIVSFDGVELDSTLNKWAFIQHVIGVSTIQCFSPLLIFVSTRSLTHATKNSLASSFISTIHHGSAFLWPIFNWTHYDSTLFTAFTKRRKVYSIYKRLKAMHADNGMSTKIVYSQHLIDARINICAV